MSQRWNYQTVEIEATWIGTMKREKI